MLWTADGLAEHAFPRTYLFEPIIPRDGIVFFYGKRNIGKSHVVLGAALCVTHGGRWFGRYPTSKGTVVYVQSDMGPELEQQRVHAAKRFYSLDNLHFWFPDFLNLPGLMHDDPMIQEINALNPSMIIWDTLRKTHRLPNNDDDTPSWVYGAAKRLFPHCVHWFVHHDKKDIVDQNELEPDELFRGTGAWLDDCDTGIHVSSVTEGRLALEFTKIRSAAQQPPVHLVLNPEALLLYTSGERILDMIQRWKTRNPKGSEEELRQFLLASFVGGPAVIDQALRGMP
jgi:AAA domain-containing protein